MTVREIALRRLSNQHVRGRPIPSPEETVRYFGAVQAQDYRGGLWAIGLRTRGADEAAIEQAIAEKSIVRTWPMRGTLHFVAADDVRWMLPLLTPRVISRTASRHRQLGLDRSLFPVCRRLFEKTLQGGKQRTRDEMYGLLRGAGIPPDGQRGIHILQQLAQDGVLCFGPRRGKQFTFVLLDEWVPPSPPKIRDEALAELALRYFNSHGPATVQDFAWWTGLSLSDARKSLDFAAPQLDRNSVGGKEFWGPRTRKSPASTGATAVLLPPFDELLVAYKDREAAVDPAHVGHVPSLLSPTMAVNGRILGTWTRTFAKDRVIIVPRFFDPPSAAGLRLVAAAARRYGEFLGREAELK